MAKPLKISRNAIKLKRNPIASIGKRATGSGFMKDKRASRGGARNSHRDLLDDFENESRCAAWDCDCQYCKPDKKEN